MSGTPGITRRKLTKLGVPTPLIDSLPVHVPQPLPPYKKPSTRTIKSPMMELSVPAQIRYRDKTEQDRMAQVRERYPRLVRQYFGFILMPFQRKLLDSYFEGGRQVNLLPTEHAKSTLGLVVFPILSLMEDPNAAHILVATNLSAAKSWLYQLDLHLTTNTDLLRDYPWLGKPTTASGRIWNKNQIIVAGRSDRNNRNPSVFATGRGDRDIKGRRGKTILDDLEGLGAVRESEREELYRWITLEAWRTMEDPGFVKRPLWSVQGTPFDPDSLYYRLHQQDIRMYRQPYKYETGKYIWPAKKLKIAEFRKHMDPAQFAIAMELDPTGGDASLLSMDEIVKRTGASFNSPPEESTWATYISLDPASGSKRRRADYAGITVSRIHWPEGDSLPFMEVVYAEACRLGVFEQVHRVADLARQFNCPVIFEGNSQQRGTYTSIFNHFHPETSTIVYITTKEKKTDPALGLTVLTTLLHHFRLRLVEPKGLYRPADRPAGNVTMAEQGLKTLLRELRDLGTGSKDHLCMSLWFVLRHTYERSRRRPQNQIRPSVTFNRDFGSTRVIDLTRFRGGSKSA